MRYVKYILSNETPANLVEGGETVGFIVKMQQPDYRGLFLTSVDDILVRLDGEEFHKDKMKLRLKTGTYTFDEMTTMAFNRWNFAEYGEVLVYKPGGIAPGKHLIEAGVRTRNSQNGSVGDYTCGRLEFVIE